ncbi:MAG: InlB B-repeat-containing protein, partial [Acholeplasmatales bacterium]|nr:InlB B-repeat-containing protein [Acholeplasmatales bacterium]
VTPTDPERAKTAQYTYTFDGWDSEVVTVAGNKTYTAKYKSTVNKYTITWMNGDALLTTTEVEYGTLPTYNGVAPTKTADQQYTYTFAGWTVTPVAVTEATTYYAKYNTVTNKYLITWKNGDSVIYSQEVEYGQTPVFTGSEPTKAKDQQYTYTFDGWDSEVVAVTGAKTYTAKYSTTVNKYTITWVNYDGTELASNEVEYGTLPTYTGETPVKPNDSQYSYTFNGWNSEVVAVTGAKTYTAVFTNNVNKYTITWVNWNDDVLEVDENVSYNAMPEYNGETPIKAANQQYTYTFDGWDTEVVAVTGDKTYKATFNSVINKYTITWKNGDSIIYSQEVEYGQTPVFTGSEPTKAKDQQYTYTFAGWDSEVVAVTGAKTYTATYSTTVNEYTITWMNGDTLLDTTNVAYGELPTYTGETPTKASTVDKTYTFAGWTVTPVAVTGAATYYAKFDESVNKYNIKFVNGSITLQEGLVEYGQLPTYEGETPTKNSTDEWDYTFVGWDKSFTQVTGDETYTALFTSTKRKYTVTWKNGDVELYNEKVEYGITPTYSGETPVKESTAQYTYEFAGWEPEVDAVTGNITYTATFTPIVRKYTYSFYSENGTSTYKVFEADYGIQIIAPSNPTKSGDLRKTYVFAGWYTSKDGGELVSEFGTLTGNVGYFARFTETEKKYTITWMDGTDELAKLDNVGYDTEYPNETPTKAGYTFDSWEESVSYSIIIRTALFTENKEEYTVTWLNDDGTLLRSDKVVKNEKASYGTKPAKSGYKFVYWAKDGVQFDVNNTIITSDITLKAVYAEVYSVGFGSSYTPWSELVTSAGSNVTTDSKGRQVLNTNVSLNGFTFVNNSKNLVSKDNTTYNNQASDIIVTLAKEGSIFVSCSWASTSGVGYITVKDSSDNEVYKSESISGSGTTCSFSIDDLEAETYTIHSDYSLNITSIHYEVVKEYVNVNFVTNVQGSTIDPVRIVLGTTLQELPDLQRDGYKLVGWCTDVELNNPFDITNTIDTDTILYAKWVQLAESEMATVTFDVNVQGESIPSVTIEKGTTVYLPTLDIDGYRFDGWYSDILYHTAFNPSTIINEDTIIYANYVKQYTITYQDKDGNVIATKKVDENTAFGEVATVSAPYVEGYLFDYWTNNENEFTDTDDITSDVVLKAHYKADDGQSEKINITRTEGLQESAYVLFDEYNNADNYSIYEIDSANNTRRLSNKEYYITRTTTGLRADLFGLKAGSHKIMVVPEISGTDVISFSSQTSFYVEAYDRSGYAHFNYTDGVGAYNDDGTLKDNAIVLYVTDQNKNTVELTYGGITVRGIGNILNSVGQACGEAGHENECKKVSSGKIYYAQANTNQGIMKKLAEANIPLVVRFVGVVSNTGLYKKGTFNASNTSLIEGLTEYDSNNYGGSEGDNGHMARIKSGKNITLEGVGSDATIDGWGFHFMASSDSPDLGKSFEVRNLKFINTPEDAIGMEGVQSGSVISASVERCWIHNNEFYSPDIASAAESDKSEGDGSCDFKRGMYFTCSYNYFEGCHKTNLVGSSDSSLQYNLTYHHNYWYMCKARGPLTRQANVHMYNNIFYGQTDYAMNTRANAYIFSESNLFYACKNPYRVDGGAIKSYNDSVSSALQSYTAATVVTDKNTAVTNENCKYNGVSYSSFELNSELFYKDDYYLQEDPTDAKKVIYARTGTAKASLPVIEDITMDDISYVNEAVTNVTVNNLTVNGQTIETGKLSKTIYAFKITESAKATITYQYDTDDKTGVLCNQAGVALLKASGTVELKPGIYFIQPYNFQPGDSKTLAQLVFKEIASVSIKLDEFDDSEYQNTLISEFNALVDALPSPIEYNDTCLSKINAAFAKYNQLNDQSKVTVSSRYNTLVTANNTYKSKGILYVENMISQIVTPVTEANADKVYAARSAYNELLNKVPSATVSNYNDLLSAESQLEKIAVNIFLTKVDELPATITYTDSCLEKIVASENAYEALTESQKMLEEDDADVVAAYAKLVSARNTYNNLEEEANKVTVSFVAEGLTIDPIRIKKDTKLTLPTDPYKEGYRFDGWYTNPARTIPFNSSTLIDEDTILYAKFVEQVTVTFINKDGTSILATRLVDKDTSMSTSIIPNAKYESGYQFSHWSLTKNGSAFDMSNSIASNTTLYSVYTESSIASVAVTLYGGDLESLYAEFNKLNGFTDYNVYVRRDGDSTFTLIDKQLIREYSSYYRVDVLGLKAGTYSFKVVPFDNQEYDEAATVITNISVKEHIRTGFAFVNGSASGAYNNDGTLRSDATVIYVTESNKDTVTFNGATGVQNIITLLKGNKGYSKPICIRFIGNITDPSVLQKGDLYVDTATAGLTIEGVGKDATINGFGIVIKNSSNVEIRNLGFMNCNSSEGDSIGLQQGNNHCWVHNNDIFYGDAGSDADQVKGDGALDTKKSTYITHSFNHFWDTGKSNLQGMKDETTSNYITYHHNWYDHSDSRHPRIRTCTVHIYNNYFDGNAKYGVGMTMGGSAFVENNYFRSTATMKPMLISGQGTDAQGEGTFSGEAGGVIKAYGNKFDGNVSFISHTQNATSFDAYVATSRDEVVPSTIKALSGGTTYNNFDTNSSLMYTYSVETPDEAKNTVTSYAGRVQGGDFTWTFNNAVDDSSYAVNNDLKSALMAYTGKLVKVLGIEGSTQGGETPTPDTSIDDVINMIAALPEPANVTLDNTSAIYAARTAYQKLSSEEQASVTNYSKLQQCIQRLNELGNDDEEQTSGIIHFNDSKINSSGTVSITESSISSYKTDKGSVTYSGTTYGVAAKFDSNPYLTIKTSSACKMKIWLSSAKSGGKFKVGDEIINITTSPEMYEVDLAANTTYTLSRSDKECYLFLIVLE